MHKLKSAGKRLLVGILGWQIRRLRSKHHDIKVIAVAGSVGKTSTKLAIAHVLSSQFRVRYQSGNYNDALSVPLIFFGLNAPAIWNIPAWLLAIMRAELSLHRPYEYDFVIVELGTDRPGDMDKFRSYIRADIGVLTAIAPEHMENFETLDEVAAEELIIAELSDQLFVNHGDVDSKYLVGIDRATSYGMQKDLDYSVAIQKLSSSLKMPIKLNLKKETVVLDLPSISKDRVKSALVAAVIAHDQGFSAEAIRKSLQKLPPIAGRMQLLAGKKGSLIIDDTYNSSPAATISALSVLGDVKSRFKVAILGSMNELGDSSEELHKIVAEACNPESIDLLVTIGHDALLYIAPVAKQRGIAVRSFLDPVSAGKFVLDNLKSHSLVLAKGSQNGVFAEESVKLLLAKPEDTVKLVRQSRAWIRAKQRQFPRVESQYANSRK